MNYCVMVFDLKNSRKLANRHEIQMNLIAAIKKCNQMFAESIVSPFLITLGDEWQGLLKKEVPFQSIIDYFHKELPTEIEFYVGIGYGEVTVHDYELTVNQLDGPAFYMARDAIDYAKEKDYRMVLIAND